MNLSDYISRLVISQGQGVGEPFNVLPWQRRFLKGAFSVDGDAALSVARGNGKSTLIAGIACAAIDGPLMEQRADVVCVGSSFEQATIIFGHARNFLDLTDRSKWRVWDTAQKAQIENRITGARLVCRGADPGRLHGLAPKLVLCDEPAQWKHTQRDAMLSALRTAMGKIPGSRLIALGTRPASTNHWFAKMLAGGCDYGQVHAASPDDPKFQRKTWLRGNPSLPFMPELEKRIRQEAREGKIDPNLMAGFDALRLNLGTSDVLESHLLEAGTWERIESPHREVGTGSFILGTDIGGEAAMTACAAFYPGSGRLEVFAMFPEKPSLAERGLKDGVGNAYLEMAKRKELLQAGEYAPDLDAMFAEVLRRWGCPSLIVADRWKEGELRNALSKANFPMAGLELRGMGYQQGSEDVRAFRKSCVTGKVAPEVSLLLRSSMAEAKVISDIAGNCKLAKGTEGGRRLRCRDDAVAASILAVAQGSRLVKNPEPDTGIHIIRAS